MPAERFPQITRGLQVGCDQRGVLVDRTRVTLFDHAGQAAVQLGASRLQLRLIGHRADQRMPERVLGVRGEHHRIDQFRCGQLLESRVPEHADQRLLVKPQTDHGGSIQGVLGRPPRRSIRAAMMA